MCHMSRVMCHLSHVTCHLLHVKIIFIKNFIKKKIKNKQTKNPKKIGHSDGASFEECQPIQRHMKNPISVKQIKYLEQ